MTLKNRICMTAVDLNYCEVSNGHPSERFKDFYYRRAEGGAALFTVGGCRFDATGCPGSMFLSLEDDSYIPTHREFVDGMHQRGAKVAVQLYHGGRYIRQSELQEGLRVTAPSAVFCRYTKETPTEAPVSELKRIIRDWAAGAVRAKKAGYDAVELIGSAGYLITEFLSPVTNLRTDEYGGSFENRLRFPLEVISAVRDAVGANYPIIMRFAANDFVEGSCTITETVEIARAYEKAGVDMLSATGGWHETTVPQLPGEVPHANFAYLSQELKKAVSIPVIMANRIQDPYTAEAMLAMKQADCVGLCRTLIADPDWPRKLLEHREKELCRCVGCNQGCLANTFFGKPVVCLVNPDAGFEGKIDRSPTDHPKRILVIGAGPAGMKFSIEAAQRGHHVTLWEKTGRIGGQLHMVATPPGKHDFADLIPYYAAMLKKAGVTLVLNQEATVENVRSFGADEVVIATGAHARIIPVENPGGIPVVPAMDVMDHKVIPGQNVVILGGGAIGCETAQYLAAQSTISAEQLHFLTIHHAETPEYIERLVNVPQRHVNIVELASRIGSGFDRGCGWPIIKDLNRMGVGQYTNARIISSTDHSVSVCCTEEGQDRIVELPCDTIVLAVGSIPENALYESLTSAGLPAHVIGDACKVGRVLDANRQACDLSERI